MNDEKWRKVREVFDSALRRPPDERQRFVKKVCGDDKTLLAEIESLLSSLDSAGKFMETPAVAKVADVIEAKTEKLESGTCFGHYEIIKQIGAGGMGEVYLTKDKKLDRRVAVKILNEKFSRDESNLNRFIQEAKAASALNHPNILVIHEIGETEDAHFIVSEFIEGKTLREVIRESRLRLPEILDIAIQISGALFAAHKARLVHRDIKPENIMVRPDGYVKILDFGLAKLVEQKNKSILGLKESTAKQNQTAKGVILGTVNYMSPEQAKGERVDERTDIFSFGALVYEMIAGRTPFAGDSTSETLANLINAEPPPLACFASNLPDELERIVSKMIGKNADERYQTMKDALTDLKDLRENLKADGTLAQAPATKILHATTGAAKKQTAAVRYSFWQQIKQRKSLAALILAALFSGAIAFGGWLTNGTGTTFEAAVLSAPFASEKLSTNGRVFYAVISPDGETVVYTNKSHNEKQSVWLRQLETGNNVEIVPPSDNMYFGLAYAPDGNSIYFARRPRNAEGQTDVYRVSIFGGVPQKIVGETQGWIGVSPDGAKISFVRCYYRDDEFCSLWVADAADGRNERKLVSRPRPLRIGDNEFSPDGRFIAFAAGQSNNAANDFSLSAIDIESGAERRLTTEKFFDIKSLAWLPDQKNLLLTASKIPNKNSRIWQVSAATGEVEPLSKDSETYANLSLDKTACRLIATKFKQDFRLRVFDLKNASVNLVLADATHVAFAPDGKIFYTSTMSGNDEIWSVDGDGSGQRQLTNDPAEDRMPIVAPDNSQIYFASNRTGAIHVWRMNADGSLQTKVTRETGGFPVSVSPDGEWLYFHHGIDRTLWRVSTRSGEEQMILNKAKYCFALSPDGSFAAFAENIGGEKFVVIVSLADGQTVEAFKYADPKGKLVEIAWLLDGEGVLYILSGNEFRKNTLWLQPFGDTKTPKKIADLDNEEISGGGALALAPDGKTFAVVQGGWLHDAVLLKGLK